MFFNNKRSEKKARQAADKLSYFMMEIAALHVLNYDKEKADRILYLLPTLRIHELTDMILEKLVGKSEREDIVKLLHEEILNDFQEAINEYKSRKYNKSTSQNSNQGVGK